MKPIEIKIFGRIKKTSQEICSEFLDTERWSEFEGYSILPGVKNAHFETRTSDLTGSRIKVQNTDGSSHVEVIIKWDTEHKIAMKFQEFNSPLQHLATHFIEEWSFLNVANETEVTRTMTMYPNSLLGWLMLIPICLIMKKAFEKNYSRTT